MIAWSVQTALYLGIVVSDIATDASVSATGMHCTHLLSVQELWGIFSLAVHPRLWILVDTWLVDHSPWEQPN